MAIRVCADTITDITSSRDFHGLATIPVPPRADDLIKKIRNQLHGWAQHAKAQADDPEVCPRTITSKENLKLFNKMMDDVPAGFKLVPVFYKRIDKRLNDQIEAGYRSRREDFLKFLAKHHAKELKALGICDHGIARMRKGADPANKKNRYYDVSVDHIIERSGSGKMSHAFEVDKDAGEDFRKSKVNHYGNLILMPAQVHEFKNRLNALQGIDKLQTANTRWILMLVPERDENSSGFVAQPQTSEQHRLRFINDKQIAYAYNQTAAAAKKAESVIQSLEAADSIKWLTRSYAAICRRPEGKQSSDACAMVETLGAMLAADTALAKKIETELVPAIKTTVKSLRGLFNGLSHKLDSRRARAAFEDFVDLYQGGAVGALRDKVESLPVEAVQPLTKIFTAIDRRIDSLYTAFGEREAQRRQRPGKNREWEDRKVHQGAGRSPRMAA